MVLEGLPLPGALLGYLAAAGLTISALWLAWSWLSFQQRIRKVSTEMPLSRSGRKRPLGRNPRDHLSFFESRPHYPATQKLPGL